MDINNIDPITQQILQQLMNPGAAMAEEQAMVPPPMGPIEESPTVSTGDSSLMNFLKQFSPVNVTEGPDSTTFTPGSIPQAITSAAQWPPAAMLQASQAVKQTIKDLMSRISLTPEGINIKKAAPANKASAVFSTPENQEPTTAVEPVSKSVRQVPTIPSTGTSVGRPEYSMPTPTQPSMVPIPSTVAEPTPSAPPVPIPSEKEIAAGITPYKSKTDFMENLTQIMNEAIPKWEDLPKPKYRKPSNLLEWLGEAGRLLALNRSSGKVPYDVVRSEEKDAENIANQEKEFVVKRAAQVANLKLMGLQHQVAKEEADRANQAHFLEFVYKTRPEAVNSLPFIQAVAANRGVPPEEAAKIIQQGYDPATGQLKLYITPEERMEQHQKALWNVTEQGLVDAGMPRDRARYVSRGGSKEYMDFMVTQLQSAMMQSPPDTVKAQAISKNISTYKAMMNVDVEQQRALDLLQKDPSLKSFDKLFADSSTANYFKNTTIAHALGFKDKVPLPHPPTEVKVAEKIKQEAKAALGNPITEKAFTDKYKHNPLAVLFTDEEAAANLPEPYGTAAKMAPKNLTKTYDGLKAWTEDPTVRANVDTVILNKFKPVFDNVNTYLQQNKKPFLSKDEQYRIATSANTGNNDILWQTVAEILTERKIPLPKK